MYTLTIIRIINTWLIEQQQKGCKICYDARDEMGKVEMKGKFDLRELARRINEYLLGNK